MIDALVARWGADPIQWRALVGALLRIDFPIGIKNANREERRNRRGIVLLLLFFVLYGITPLIVVLSAKDLLVGATVSVAISSFAVAMTLMSGEADSLLASTDLQVLGHRPVSSRTYLAVRITTLLVRATLISGATSLLPAIGYLIRFGLLNPVPALALAISAQLAGVAATFGIVALYAFLVERVDAESLKKYVAYSQMAASFVVWAGFLIVTQELVKQFVAGLRMDPALWLLFPPTWFGSLVPLAQGQAPVWSIVGSILAIASLAGLGWLIRDKLSMGYAEGLTKTAKVETTPLTRGSIASWMPAIRNESRAVLLLARSQIVYDMKFRTALISLVPMTVIYMFMGGWPDDPFTARRGGNAPLLQMVVMFLPLMVRQVIVQNEAQRAAWILHTTPARRSTLLSASRSIITAFFLLPYLAVMAAFFAYSFGSSAHALIHVAFMGMLSSLILAFDMMLRPQLPFSVPPLKDTKFGMQFITLIVGGIVGTGFYFLLVHWAYRSAGRMLVSAATGLALIALMETTARRRLNRRRVEDLYFE